MPRGTLANQSDLDAVLGRFGRLQPDSPRQWGRMSPHDMLCHVADAFGMALGRLPVAERMTLYGLSGPVMKWLALSLPMTWPHGIRGPAEVDPHREGTRPAAFAADSDRVVRLIRQFAAEVGPESRHPMFGPMTRADWLRWGYLHCDHHLRQFGC